MNQLSDTKRLADATTVLAATVVEIINERLWAISAVQAELLQLSARTVDQWMSRGCLASIES